MKERSRTLLKGTMAIWSVLLLVLSALIPFFPFLQPFYPLLILPIVPVMVKLLINEWELKMYRMAALLFAMLLAMLAVGLSYYFQFHESILYHIAYYLLLVGLIILSLRVKSPKETGTNFFYDVRNLPPLFFSLIAPIILAFGINIYLIIVKSDIVLAMRSSYKRHQNEVTITNPKALNHFQNARSLLHSNQLDASLRELKASLKAEPENAYIHYALYHTYQIKGELSIALDHINKAIEIDSTTSEYLCDKSYLLLQRGEDNQAIQSCEKAKKLDANCPATYYLKAQISMVLENNSPEITYAYLDSAYYYCDDINLKYQLKQFKEQNCGLNYFLNKIKPYMMTWVSKINFYSATHPLYTKQFNSTLEKYSKNDVAKDQTIHGIKNFIRLFSYEFKEDEVTFTYYIEDNQRYLNVILAHDSQLSINHLYEVFQSDLFSSKVKLRIVKDGDFKYL